MGGHFPAFHQGLGIWPSFYRLRFFPRSDTALANREPAGAAPTEMAVDALENHGGKVLDFEAVGALDAHYQGRRAPFIHIRLRAAWPFKRDRLADLGKPFADDLRPGEHHVSRCEAAGSERLAERGRDKVGDRPADLAWLAPSR